MMLNRRLFLGGVASTAVLATLSACAKNSDSGSGSDSTSAVNSHKREDLESGGELRIPMSATIPNWNYQHVDGNGVDLRNIMDFVLPYCLDWDDKGDFKANPDFYTTFEAEEVDGKTVVTIGLFSCCGERSEGSSSLCQPTAWLPFSYKLARHELNGCPTSCSIWCFKRNKAGCHNSACLALPE